MSDEHGDTKRPMSLRDWFDRLADLPAAEQREALAKLDAERPDVAGELRQMLAVGDDDAVPSAIAALGGKMLGDRLGMGDRVGPYVVLEHLASGGFGDVYKAERRTPHRQTVALKLIKPGVDTREVIARFSSERQALARMDHPHIAKVLDAGSTDAGRPYFVMEYVRGVPITTFADDNKLTIPQRLELF
ncbi:MAG: protein kinase, partial [Planctomycetota bacterium]